MTASSDDSLHAAARRAMVESQLRPQAVIDRGVLAAMARVPRERFVPAAQAALAYVDRVIPLGNGRFLSPPAVTGRLLSELAPQPGERALVVGSATGYSAALLADIGLQVTALDTMPPAAPVPGVEFVSGPLAEGWAKGGPYDLMLIDGAIAQPPDALAGQLAPDGRIGVVIRERGVDRLMIGRRTANGFGLRSLVDADAADLPGFERPAAFAF